MEICTSLLMLAAQRDTCYNKSLRGPDPFQLQITFAKSTLQPSFPAFESVELFSFPFWPHSGFRTAENSELQVRINFRIRINVTSD